MNDRSISIGLFIAMIALSVLTSINSSITTYEQTKEVVMSDNMGGMENKENSNVSNGFMPLNPNPNPSQPANTTIQNLSFSNLNQTGSAVLGKPLAPITIIQFSDFQCRFCGRFAKQTIPLLNQTYIQTGKVNLVFKHFVTNGRDSLTAAIASQCANEQGRFWNFYKILYGNQGDENSGWANSDNMKKFASRIPGMDMKKFNSCLDSQKYKSIVENDTAFAFKSGFQGTPTLIVEKSDGSKPEVFVGAYPFVALQAIIEKKMSEV